MASGSEQYRILLDTSQLGEGVNRGTREFDRLGVSAEDAGARIDSAMKKAGAAAASYFTAQYLKQFTADIIKTRSEIESYEVAFRTLLGNEQLSKKFFGEIREFAVNTPLMLNTLAGGAQTMLGFNIEAGKVIPTLKMIGDISMGDEQRFQSLTLAFSQMSSTGKLMGQDLLQMINAGFNPLSEISRKTGKNIAVLKDEMSKGLITSEMVADAFKSATEEGGKFHGMLEKQSKAMKGSISNFMGAIDDMKNAIGEGMQPAITSSISGLTTLVKHYEDVGKAILVLASAVGTYKAIDISAHLLASVRSLSALTTAIKASTVAQAAFNAVARANPYVLLASAVVSVATAMWAFRDSSTEAEKATRLLTKQQEELSGKMKEHEDAVSDLMATVTDETKAEIERNTALERLRSIYPSVFGQYNTAIELTRKKTEAQREFNEELARERSIQERANRGDNKTILAYLNKERSVRKAGGTQADVYGTDEYKRALAVYKRQTGAKNGDLFTAWLSKNYSGGNRNALEQAVKQQDAKAADENQAAFIASIAGMSQGQIKSALAEVDRLKGEMEKSGKRYIQTREGIILSIEKVNERAKKLREQAASNEAAAKANPYKDALREYEQAAKAVQELERKARANDLTSKEKGSIQDDLKSAREREKAAKEAYENLGGDMKARQKAEKAADKAQKALEQANARAVKAAEKQADDKEKELEFTRKARDAEYSLRQMRIDNTTNGAERNRLQIELDYDKALAAVKDWKDEQLRSIQEDERRKFEIDFPDYVKEGRIFEPLTKTLPAELQKIADGMAKEAEKARDKAMEAEAWRAQGGQNATALQYGTYEQRRAALTSNYQHAMGETTDDWERESLRKKYEEDLRALDTLFGKTIGGMADLFADASQKSIASIRATLEKYQMLVDYMQAEGIAGGEGGSGRQVSMEQLQERFPDAEQLLQGLQGDPERMKAVTDAVKKLLDTLKQKSPWDAFLANVRKYIDLMKKGGASNIGEGLAGIIGEMKSLLPQIQDFGSNIANIMGKEDSGVNKAMKGIEGGLDVAQGAAKMMSGDIVGGLMDGIKGISALVDVFGGSNMEAMEAAITDLTETNKALKDAMDDLKDVMAGTSGRDATAAYEQARALLERQQANSAEIMLDEARKWERGSHSIASQLDSSKSFKALLQKVSSVLGKSVTSTGGLLSLSASDLKAIRTQDADLYNDILRAFRNAENKHTGEGIDDMISDYISQYADAFKDLEEGLSEALTGITRDTLSDDWKSLLANLDNTGKEAADNFEQYLRNAISSSLVAKEYKSRLDALTQQFADAMKDGTLTNEEADALRSQYASLYAEAQARISGLYEQAGISKLTDQSFSTGVSGMTEDQADEMNGRMTSIQMIAGELLAARGQANEQLTAMHMLAIQHLDRLAEIARNTAQANDYLLRIARNTDNI